MKKTFLILVLIATAFSQNIFAQDSSHTPSSTLLGTYYQLKNNLVKSDASAAAAGANDLIAVINTADNTIINDATKAKLLTDANAIAQSKELKKQRERFSDLSDTMIELAKTVKLSEEPIYQQYCPMKKASWLSADKAIKNPYYGNAMLTCGSVKSIL